ncbi:MAG: hypothetical protein AAFW87_01810 [Pseudomonadota bacterium]
MSAPSTNIERQKKRHNAALAWMAVAVGLVGIFFIGFYVLATDADDTATPMPAATGQSDG